MTASDSEVVVVVGAADVDPAEEPEPVDTTSMVVEVEVVAVGVVAVVEETCGLMTVPSTETTPQPDTQGCTTTSTAK